MKGPLLRPGHAVQLLHGGGEFFPALLADMEQARREIRLETYIFHFDEAGQAVAAALERAAQRGVQVGLVVDGIGTPDIPAVWQQRFAAAGVQWHRFSPLGRWGLLIPGRWRRLHRKLCVVDGQVAYCGGINVLDDHFQFAHGHQETPRYDFAVRVTGPLVQEVRSVMLQFWRRIALAQDIEQLQFREIGRWLRSDGPAGDALPEPAALQQTGAAAAASAAAQASPQVASGWQNVAATLVLRDNLLHRRQIERAYLWAIARANREVVIANAYFIPGRKLRRALAHAVSRGVRVRLLVQGRYEYFMQYHAAKPAFAELLGDGVEIYEYHTGFFHAKVAVVDGAWATVGSSNLDPLSLLLAREANVVVEHAGFAQSLLGSLDQAMTHASRQILLDTLKRRPWQQKAKDWLAYGLMRLSLFLTGRRY